MAPRSADRLRIRPPTHPKATFNATTTQLIRQAFDTTGMSSAFVMDHLLRVGRASHVLENGRELVMWAEGDEYVPNQIFWRGLRGYEPETMAVFVELARKARVTFDIGAHVGLFSLVAGHMNPAAKVFAFEPVVAIFQRLQKNLALNDLPHVSAVCCAVGRQYGTLEFFLPSSPDELPLASSLAREQVAASFKSVTATLVPVIPLDAFFAERQLEHLDLMKIDTETTEPDVFAGMEDTLKRHRPDIICEVLPGRNTGPALQQYLTPLGYHFYLLGGDGPAPRERIEGDQKHLNYLFTARPQEQIENLRAAILRDMPQGR